jgi:hypothetical protein
LSSEKLKDGKGGALNVIENGSICILAGSLYIRKQKTLSEAEMAFKYMGESHCTLIVVASTWITDCAEIFENGNEHIQSFNETGNENEVTTNVNVLPPYALTERGENEARKGVSDASKLNEKFASATPSRSVQITSDLDERLNAGGSITVSMAEDIPVLITLTTVALLMK